LYYLLKDKECNTIITTMPVNSEERLIYFRKYHKDRRKEEPELYKERGRLAAATYRAKHSAKIKQNRIDELQKKIDNLKVEN
jgi:hypothetical protein